MSQELTIQLSDQAYAALERQATVAGTSAAAVASSTLEERFNNGPPPTTNSQAARSGRPARVLPSWIGSIDVPDPKGLDNEQIDADLAEEYGSRHEDD
jgi:hypothetical protein